MKITNRVANAINAFRSPQAAKNAMGADLARKFMKYGNGSKPLVQDWSSLLMDDTSNYTGYMYSAFNNRANGVAQLAENNLTTEANQQLMDAASESEEPLVHPYLAKIDSSTTFSNYKFWYGISSFLDLKGVYYLMAIRAGGQLSSGENYVSPVKEFILLNPFHVRRVVNGNGELGGYIEERDGKQREIPADMIIEIKKFNPFSYVDPYSTAEAAKEAQFTIKQSGDFARHALQKNINSPGIITIGDSDMVVDEQEFANFKARVTGHEKGEPIFGVGDGALKWDPMQIDLDKAALPDISEINLNGIIAVTGNSKTMFGIEQSGVTRDTAKVQKDLFIGNHTMPQLQLIVDALNLDYQRNYPKEYEANQYKIVIDSPLKVDRDAELADNKIKVANFDLYSNLVNQGYDPELAAKYVEGKIDLETLSDNAPEPKEDLPEEGTDKNTKKKVDNGYNPYRESDGKFGSGPKSIKTTVHSERLKNLGETGKFSLEREREYTKTMPNKYEPSDPKWGTEPGEYTVYRAGGIEREVLFTSFDKGNAETYAEVNLWNTQHGSSGVPFAVGDTLDMSSAKVNAYTVKIEKPFVSTDLWDAYQKVTGKPLQMKGGETWIAADLKVSKAIARKGYDSWIQTSTGELAIMNHKEQIYDMLVANQGSKYTDNVLTQLEGLDSSADYNPPNITLVRGRVAEISSSVAERNLEHKDMYLVKNKGYNPYRDSDGKFTTGGGGSSVSDEKFGKALGVIVDNYELPVEERGKIYKEVKGIYGIDKSKPQTVSKYSSGGATLYKGTNGSPIKETSWEEFDSPNGHKFMETNSGLYLTADKLYAESYGKTYEFNLKKSAKIINSNDDYGEAREAIKAKAKSFFKDDFESSVKVQDMLTRDQGLLAVLGGYDGYITSGLNLGNASEVVIVNMDKLEVLKDTKNTIRKEIVKNAAEDQRQGIINQQQSALQNSIQNVEARMVALAIKRVESKKVEAKNDVSDTHLEFEDDELITDAEQREFQQELAIILAAFYGIVFLLNTPTVNNERLKEFQRTADYKLDKSSKDQIKAIAKKASTSHVNTINDTILKDVRKQAATGASQQQIISSLTQTYAGEITEVRAKAIARTETNRAFTMSQYEYDRQFLKQNAEYLLADGKKAYKQWRVRSANPCQFCLDLQAAGPIPFDDAFAEIGDVLSYTTEKDGKTKVHKMTVGFDTPRAGNLHTNCGCDYTLIIK